MQKEKSRAQGVVPWAAADCDAQRYRNTYTPFKPKRKALRADSAGAP